MNDPAHKNRRHFLKEAACAAAATGVAADLSQAEMIDQGILPFDLGMRPDRGAVGAVIVKKGDRTFVTFAATRAGLQGQAVIELVGCKAWKSEVDADSGVARDSLPLGSFEALDSAWAKTQAKGLRHFVITFDGNVPGVTSKGVPFECLAEDIKAEFVTSSIDRFLATA